jgi:hypothetical protein
MVPIIWTQVVGINKGRSAITRSKIFVVGNNDKDAYKNFCKRCAQQGLRGSFQPRNAMRANPARALFSAMTENFSGYVTPKPGWPGIAQRAEHGTLPWPANSVTMSIMSTLEIMRAPRPDRG